MEATEGCLCMLAHDSLARVEPVQAVALSQSLSPDLSYRVTASRLQGVVQVSGAKNSVLRLLAASLLTDGTVEIANYPGTVVAALFADAVYCRKALNAENFRFGSRWK